MPKRGLQAIIAAVLAVLLALVGASAASAAVKVTATAPATFVAGGSAKVTIAVSGTSARTAKLQVKSGSKWTTAARTIKLTKGKGTTTVAPGAARTYRIKVGSAYSKAFTVTPIKRTLKVTLGAATIVKGASTAAKIVLSPSANGSAKLQVKEGSSWTTAARSIKISKGKGSTTLAPASTRTYRVIMGSLKSAAFTITVNKPNPVPASFTVKGSGWGHGVGMSQYGAYGMALDGNSAADILTHYFAATKVERVPAKQDLRVQVYGSGSDAKDSVQLKVVKGTQAGADGQWRLRFYDVAGGATVATTWTGTAGEALQVTRAGGVLTVSRANGDTASGRQVVLHWEGTQYFQPTSAETASAAILTKAGAAASNGTYRHGRLLVTATGGRINIVNSLDLNTEYLLGIAEMPSSWPAAALQAQAIAARGYAVRALAGGLDSTCRCNLYDDTRSQNFTGWKKENEGTDAVYGKRWVAAVTATSDTDGVGGDVLTYGSGGVGKIATTYYFSSSGGQTENSEQVWASAVSYLRSAPDPWSLDSRVANPNAAWTFTLSQAKAKAAFGLSDIVKITVAKRTSSASTAAAYQLTATSKTGATATITGADAIRIKLGVKSPWVWSVTAN